MTESEAKGFIQGKLDCMNECGVFNREDITKKDLCDYCDYCYSQGNFGEQKEAFQMAINALEKQMKLNKMGDCYIIPKNGVFEVNGVDVNLAIQKQIPKKPILKHDASVMHINRGNQPHEWKRLESDNWHCPECDSFVGERVYVHDRHHDQRKKKYCDNCGQKLNWESDK